MSEIQGALLHWREEDNGRYGDGISRPKASVRARPFVVIVYKPGAMPMTVTMRAENKTAAIKYAQNRWPSATVEAA
jgi:hypothetical protein